MEVRSPGLNCRAGTSVVGERLPLLVGPRSLPEYDGLTLKFLRRRSRRWDSVRLDACWAAAVADAKWMNRYSELTAARLTPIGGAYSEQ